MPHDWTYYTLRVLVHVSNVAAVLIVLVYALSPWWRSAIGRGYMTMKVSMALTLSVISVTYIVGDYPGRRVVQLGLYGFLAVALWNQVRIQVKARRGTLPEQRHLVHRCDCPPGDV